MTTPLRVLQLGKFYWPHRGGIETYLRSLCVRMKGHVDLQVIVANHGLRTTDSVVDDVPVTRVGTLFRFASTPICPRMIYKVRETRADLVHIHLPNPWALLAYFRSGHPGKLIISYHSDIVRQRILGRGFEPIVKHAMERSSAVIAASPNYIDSSPILRAYRDRCHVIPFGVPQELYDIPDKTIVNEIRRRFGERLVLSVGRLVYYKGFDYLIQAMRRIRGNLLIIGEGPLRHALEERAAVEGVRDRVFFLGDIDNPIPFYQAADVFVLASTARSEAFGIVQLEAMACGKPVVNTSLNSGVPFVSRHGQTGLTVPPGDAQELTAAINLLLNDDELRDRYGRAAKIRVRNEFSLGAMADRTLQLYRHAMGLSASLPNAPASDRVFDFPPLKQVI
jgi:glycosyltransferase involved in cell wall biosynthesis